MFNRRIGWRTALAAGVATVVVASLNPPVAFADTTQPSLVGIRNSSDPHVEGCYTIDPVSGLQHDYWCMYASFDLDQAPQPYFAMDGTYVYTFDPASGKNPADPSSWVDRSRQGNTNLIVPAFSQSKLPFAPGNRMNHLWAPTAFYGNTHGETLLFVPDIYGDRQIPGISGDGEVSYIAVATSLDGMNNPGANPWGPFAYKKAITWGGGEITDSYMSDPAVVTLAQSHPIIDENWRDAKTNRYPCRENWVYCHYSRDAATWLLWANGDNNNNSANCGDLSIGWLRDNDFTDLVNPPTKNFSEIQINGIDALGVCPGANHPYLEGPELYDLTQVNVPLPTNPTTGQSEQYALFFSAKPQDRNQVLAWASGSSPQGPYTYRGVLMEASTTSWTNHGSIIASTITGSNGQSEARFIMFYHDEADRGSNDPHHRKTRAVCLQYSRNAANPGFLTAARYETNPPSVPDLRNCVSMVP